LRIWVDGVEIPAEHLVVANLSPLPGVSPENWRRPPASIVQTATKPGKVDRTFGGASPLVGFDPVLGRISLPTGVSAQEVDVAYAYGFPGDVGGGPYDRRPVLGTHDAAEGLLDPRHFDDVLRIPDDHPSVASAVGAIVVGKRTLIIVDQDRKRKGYS
jgi:hypothetical protein